MPEFPFISIIIPVYNEEEFLKHCLAAVFELNYPKDKYEVIVVDNGSCDNTQSIAKSFNVKLLSLPSLTISAVRNFGAKNSAGELLAFLDADCVPTKDWLNFAAKTVLENNCATGAPYEVPKSAGWISNAWFCNQASGLNEIKSINGGNLIIPKTIFHSVNGFDEKLKTGEDAELCARIAKNHKVLANGELKVYHLGIPYTVMDFLRREIWHGLGAFGTFQHNLLDKPLLGTIAFMVLTLISIAGIVNIFINKSFYLLISGLIGTMLLLTLTVLQKKSIIRSAQHAAQLFVLYFLYYLGRSISLFCLIGLIKAPRARKKTLHHDFNSGLL
jgi:glycosyltransferase involved in cell wall biosynthesis